MKNEQQILHSYLKLLIYYCMFYYYSPIDVILFCFARKSNCFQYSTSLNDLTMSNHQLTGQPVNNLHMSIQVKLSFKYCNDMMS